MKVHVLMQPLPGSDVTLSVPEGSFLCGVEIGVMQAKVVTLNGAQPPRAVIVVKIVAPVGVEETVEIRIAVRPTGMELEHDGPVSYVGSAIVEGQMLHVLELEDSIPTMGNRFGGLVQ